LTRPGQVGHFLAAVDGPDEVHKMAIARRELRRFEVDRSN